MGGEQRQASHDKKNTARMHISERSLSVRGVGTPRKGERTCMHRTPLLLFSRGKNKIFFLGAAHHRSNGGLPRKLPNSTIRTPQPNVTKLLNMHAAHQGQRDYFTGTRIHNLLVYVSYNLICNLLQKLSDATGDACWIVCQLKHR